MEAPTSSRIPSVSESYTRCKDLGSWLYFRTYADFHFITLLKALQTLLSSTADAKQQDILTRWFLLQQDTRYDVVRSKRLTWFHETDPVYSKLQAIGRNITQQVQPKAVVVFSAHWQGDRDMIEVNTAESLDLIYDFGGFPAHFYSIKYPNRGSPELAKRLLGLFADAGIKAKGVRRGLDHGVWASFMCAFNPAENPLNVPIVQVSLFDSDDPDQHYRLGQAVSSLRDEGVLVVASGMAVHNLRDHFSSHSVIPKPYTVSFDDALKDAVQQDPEQRQMAMKQLMKRSDLRRAHPSLEHLLPIHVAAGAAGADVGKQVWTLPEGSMSWAQYRFGEVGA